MAAPTPIEKLLQRFFWDRQVQFATEGQCILCTRGLQINRYNPLANLTTELEKLAKKTPENPPEKEEMQKVIDSIQSIIPKKPDMSAGFRAYLASMQFTVKLLFATLYKGDKTNLLLIYAQERPHLFWHCIMEPIVHSSRWISVGGCSTQYDGSDRQDHMWQGKYVMGLDTLTPQDIHKISHILKAIADSAPHVCYKWLSELIQLWWHVSRDHHAYHYLTAEFTAELESDSPQAQITGKFMALLEAVGVTVLTPQQDSTQEALTIFEDLNQYYIMLPPPPNWEQMPLTACLSMLHERIQALEVHL